MISLVNSELNLRSESQLLDDLVNRVRPTDVFWDIGTDVGTYTIIVSSYVDRTVGFEPDPIRRCETRQNCFRNDVDCRLFGVALGDGGRIEINHYDRTHEVDTVVGDRWQSRSDVAGPDVVKMDIDGGEYAAIANMESILDQCRHVYCELHPSMLPENTPDDVRDVLQGYGFTVQTLFTRGKETMIRADASSDGTSSS